MSLTISLKQTLTPLSTAFSNACKVRVKGFTIIAEGARRAPFTSLVILGSMAITSSFERSLTSTPFIFAL